MQIRIFNIPITDTGELLTEMNHFMSGHKVLEVEQRFFQNEKGGCWSFCIRHLPVNSTLRSTRNERRNKVDYKQILSEDEFSNFSILREIRKILASEDGVPAYAVFTDEELSGIVRQGPLTEKNMLAVPGIGEKKVARYGEQMLKAYHNKIVEG